MKKIHWKSLMFTIALVVVFFWNLAVEEDKNALFLDIIFYFFWIGIIWASDHFDDFEKQILVVGIFVTLLISISIGLHAGLSLGVFVVLGASTGLNYLNVFYD
ncbi:MAG: hypothetical protein NTW50_05100 [Candidatus Berkelbacteria bacterium]|nr:hypothetical protein [Candidatus Berkelbacteria bacterium]